MARRLKEAQNTAAILTTFCGTLPADPDSAEDMT